MAGQQQLGKHAYQKAFVKSTPSICSLEYGLIKLSCEIYILSCLQRIYASVGRVSIDLDNGLSLIRRKAIL